MAYSIGGRSVTLQRCFNISTPTHSHSTSSTDKPRRCRRSLHDVTVLIARSNSSACFVLIAAKSNIVIEASVSSVPFESRADPAPIHLPLVRATAVEPEVEIQELRAVIAHLQEANPATAAGPVASFNRIPEFNEKVSKYDTFISHRDLYFCMPPQSFHSETNKTAYIIFHFR